MRPFMSLAMVLLALSLPVSVRGDDVDEPSPPPTSEECSYKGVAGSLGVQAVSTRSEHLCTDGN